ncbi:hypothetical protein [Methanobacterium alcaliphilum]|nr:hypothetical protein [Methanobacterium alcaliphilum]
MGEKKESEEDPEIDPNDSNLKIDRIMGENNSISRIIFDLNYFRL